MTKIKCEWTTCKFNDAKYYSDDYGFCTKDEILLEHIDNETQLMNNDEEVVQGLYCKNYICDKGKKYK